MRIVVTWSIQVRKEKLQYQKRNRKSSGINLQYLIFPQKNLQKREGNAVKMGMLFRESYRIAYHCGCF
jgi:hypothetical protein